MVKVDWLIYFLVEVLEYVTRVCDMICFCWQGIRLIKGLHFGGHKRRSSQPAEETEEVSLNFTAPYFSSFFCICLLLCQLCVSFIASHDHIMWTGDACVIRDIVTWLPQHLACDITKCWRMRYQKFRIGYSVSFACIFIC